VGIGTRGPGEKQLEIDRRLVQRRLGTLKRELVTIQARKRREVERRNLEHFTVGLVGYTNAGKSTLFNRLTAGGAFVHSKLFASLMDRVERWDLGSGDAVMLSDTVGFIRDLPHHLVASFRSTLEETIHSHLLVIILDLADHSAPMQLETVHRTLDEIGATEQVRVLALNKIDCLQDSTELLVWLNRYPEAVPISAANGDGLDVLEEVVRGHLHGGVRQVKITAPNHRLDRKALRGARSKLPQRPGAAHRADRPAPGGRASGPGGTNADQRPGAPRGLETGME
jgi:GTP-binding protein HflX